MKRDGVFVPHARLFFRGAARARARSLNCRQNCRQCSAVMCYEGMSVPFAGWRNVIFTLFSRHFIVARNPFIARNLISCAHTAHRVCPPCGIVPRERKISNVAAVAFCLARVARRHEATERWVRACVLSVSTKFQSTQKRAKMSNVCLPECELK